MKPLVVAIVGATGLVGEVLLRVLAERRFPVGELRLFAGEGSAGRRLRFDCNDVPVRALSSPQDPSAKDLAAIDLAFFAASAQVSKAFAPGLARAGTVVVDKSPAFRLEPDVPLIVPEVNGMAIAGRRLIANPNCSTIPLAVALGPVHRAFGLRWLSLSTYQSVSGAGKDALQEYERQTRGEDRPVTVLPRRIAGNVFPENGPVDESGYGEEERKIAHELRKILADPEIAISATSVRVPVAVCHAEAVAFEPREPASLDEVARCLRSAPGVKFLEGSQYATPLEVAGTDDVVVGRLRPDTAHPGAFLAWIVADNLRKGAATNAVQIAEAACAVAAGTPV